MTYRCRLGVSQRKCATSGCGSALGYRAGTQIPMLANFPGQHRICNGVQMTSHAEGSLNEATAAVDVQDLAIHVAVTQEKGNRLSNFPWAANATDRQYLGRLRQ